MSTDTVCIYQTNIMASISTIQYNFPFEIHIWIFTKQKAKIIYTPKWKCIVHPRIMANFPCFYASRIKTILFLFQRIELQPKHKQFEKKKTVTVKSRTTISHYLCPACSLLFTFQNSSHAFLFSTTEYVAMHRRLCVCVLKHTTVASLWFECALPNGIIAYFNSPTLSNMSRKPNNDDHFVAHVYFFSLFNATSFI